MDFYPVDAEKREISGKTGLRRLKSEGFIPGILYDESGNIPISIDEHEFTMLIKNHGSDLILNLNLNGRDIEAYIKEIQRAPVSQDILHVDLMPVKKGVLH